MAEKKKFYKKWWFWVLAAFVVLMIAIPKDEKSPENNNNPGTTTQPGGNNGQNQPGTTEPKATEPQGIKITAAELYNAYDENQVAADNKYKGKTLEVSGTIEDIGKDILDTPYVTLQTENIIGTVQCMFDKSDTAVLAELKKGNSITIKGKCTGMLGNVLLDDCSVKS